MKQLQLKAGQKFDFCDIFEKNIDCGVIFKKVVNVAQNMLKINLEVTFISTHHLIKSNVS